MPPLQQNDDAASRETTKVAKSTRGWRGLSLQASSRLFGRSEVSFPSVSAICSISSSI